jgi:hypothetical protein
MFSGLVLMGASQPGHRIRPVLPKSCTRSRPQQPGRQPAFE